MYRRNSINWLGENGEKIFRMTEEQKEEALKEYDSKLIIHFKKSVLNRFLICPLCKGYIRLAHTIAECGHTFCQICIFNNLQKSKGDRSCPECHVPIENNYLKSVKKDPYMQNIVDTVFPEYSKRETIIVKKIKELFPTINLGDLFDDYKFEQYAQYNYSRKKVKMDRFQMQSLPEIVQQTLEVNFETFIKNILDDANFEAYKEKIKIVEEKRRLDYLQEQEARRAMMLERIEKEEEARRQMAQNSDVKPKTENDEEQIERKEEYKEEDDFAQDFLKKSDVATSLSRVAERKLGLERKPSGRGRKVTVSAEDIKPEPEPQNVYEGLSRTASLYSDKSESHDIPGEDFLFLLKPKADKDYQYVRINNTVKLKNKGKVFTVQTIKRYILKRMLGLYPKLKDQIEDENDSINTIINLYREDRILGDQEDLKLLAQNNKLNNSSFYILYELNQKLDFLNSY